MEQYQFSQLPYVPNNFERIQQTLNDYTEEIRSAENPEQVFSVIARCDQLMENVNLASNMAYIRSSLDCTDEFYNEAAQKEGMGCAGLNTSPFYQALLESPFLPQLEERFGPEYRPRLEKEFRIKAAGRELLAREQMLSNQYQQKKAMLQIDFRGALRSEGEMFVCFEDPDR